MKIFIEKLSLPIDNSWTCFVSPLQRSILTQVKTSNELKEGSYLAWGIQIHQQSSQSSEGRCGLLLARLIESVGYNENNDLLLSIISVSFSSTKLSSHLAPPLLSHVLEFASNQGWTGVHIGCPLKGLYGDFVRKLTASVGTWVQKPGKVVVRLSDIQRIGPLLTRLEKSVTRKKSNSQWRIEPYSSRELGQWQDRIHFSRDNRLGVPWDPDDHSYDWVPSDAYSRVIKSGNTVIGWLICHFIAHDVLRYGKLWVDPGWEQTGAPLAMLCDVMRSAHFQSPSITSDGTALGSPIPSGCFISHPLNRRLHRLMIQKFKPVCDSWTELENYYCYFE